MSEESKLEKAFMVLGSPFAAALAIGLSLPFEALEIFARGYVLSRIWAWYAVPLGMHAYSWVTFAGVFLAKSVFFVWKTKEKEEDLAHTSVRLAASMLWPWAVLLLGWWFKT